MDIKKYLYAVVLESDEVLIEEHAAVNTSLAALWATKDPLFATKEELMPDREQDIANYQKKREILSAELLKRMQQQKDVSAMSDKELYLHIDQAKEEFHKRMVGTNG